jgi:thioredoxin-related protein
MRKLLLASVLCLAAVMAAAHGVAERFDSRRDAVADVARAVAQAGAEGKNVIVDVGGEWCAWCHILHRFIARQPEVRAAIDADFVWVKVNWSPANKNERLLSAWPKVTGYPHLFVLDRSGRVIRSQPSVELEAGKDYDAAKVLVFLRDNRPAR